MFSWLTSSPRYQNGTLARSSSCCRALLVGLTHCYTKCI